MKSVVNPIGLVPSQNVYGGGSSKDIKPEFIIIDKDGGSDELRYKSPSEALEAIIDSDIKVATDVNNGLRDAQIMRRYHQHEDDYQSERSDWLHANEKEILSKYGYRIVSVTGVKS